LIKKLFFILQNSITLLKRIKPYPPSFSKTPARIIEPTTGASTWAFGNHRWKLKRGSLTTKTSNIKTHRKLISSTLKSRKKFMEVFRVSCIIKIKKGSEKTKV
jgi:hypothetical protein